MGETRGGTYFEIRVTNVVLDMTLKMNVSICQHTHPSKESVKEKMAKRLTLEDMGRVMKNNTGYPR
jgi:hypothetical protein